MAKVPTNNIFDNTKAVGNSSQYASYRGVTDFTNLKQFNMFETGHSFLVLISDPKFMNELAKIQPNYYAPIVNNFNYMLENEFRGLTGLPDITAETSEITDGITNLNVITKAQMDTAVNVSMSFWEKSGGMIAKYMELYITGIKDPKTQAKHYHGLIEGLSAGPGAEDASATSKIKGAFQNEVFQLLYVVCDNSYKYVEKAFLLCNWQPNKAETSMYDSTKGTIEFKEITIEGSCYPVTGPKVNAKAEKIRAELCKYNNNGSSGIALSSNKYDYSEIKDIKGSLSTFSTKTQNINSDFDPFA